MVLPVSHRNNNDNSSNAFRIKQSASYLWAASDGGKTQSIYCTMINIPLRYNGGCLIQNLIRSHLQKTHYPENVSCVRVRACVVLAIEKTPMSYPLGCLLTHTYWIVGITPCQNIYQRRDVGTTVGERREDDVTKPSLGRSSCSLTCHLIFQSRGPVCNPPPPVNYSLSVVCVCASHPSYPCSGLGSHQGSQSTIDR